MKKDNFYLYDMTSGEIMCPLGRMTEIESEKFETNSLRAITEHEALAEMALAQIKEDLRNQDATAIFELLLKTPKKYLKGFLPEEDI